MIAHIALFAHHLTSPSSRSTSSTTTVLLTSRQTLPTTIVTSTSQSTTISDIKLPSKIHLSLDLPSTRLYTRDSDIGEIVMVSSSIRMESSTEGNSTRLIGRLQGGQEGGAVSIFGSLSVVRDPGVVTVSMATDSVTLSVSSALMRSVERASEIISKTSEVFNLKTTKKSEKNSVTMVDKRDSLTVFRVDVDIASVHLSLCTGRRHLPHLLELQLSPIMARGQFPGIFQAEVAATGRYFNLRSSFWEPLLEQLEIKVQAETSYNDILKTTHTGVSVNLTPGIDMTVSAGMGKSLVFWSEAYKESSKNFHPFIIRNMTSQPVTWKLAGNYNLDGIIDAQKKSFLNLPFAEVINFFEFSLRDLSL